MKSKTHLVVFFAAAALTGLLANPNGAGDQWHASAASSAAYRFAEHMLKARQERSPLRRTTKGTDNASR